LWDKYRVPLGQLRRDRRKLEETVNAVLKGMSYS